MGQIWTDVKRLAEHLDKGYLARRHEGARPQVRVLASGGFDPLHLGHLNYLQHAARLGGVLLVAVNGDGFLRRKKGFALMPAGERVRLVAALACVDHAFAWDDGTPHVAGAITALFPDLFANGGDRSDPAAACPEEVAACRDAGCVAAYGVGGHEKTHSSSELAGRLRAGV